MTEWIDTRTIRCPRCGLPPSDYVEVGTHTSTFAAELGRRDAEGYHEPAGALFVRALCKSFNGCGHRWKLVGVLQITDLDIPTPPQGDRHATPLRRGPRAPVGPRSRRRRVAPPPRR